MANRRLLGVLAIAAISRSLPGQATASPSLAGCYELTMGSWSRSLGEVASFHRVPSRVRLDTMPAGTIGFVVSPDIAFPPGRKFPGTPRWTVRHDTLEIVWSNGFQPTVVRLVPSSTTALHGEATAFSDANDLGNPAPSARVDARRVTCTSDR